MSFPSRRVGPADDRMRPDGKSYARIIGAATPEHQPFGQRDCATYPTSKYLLCSNAHQQHQPRPYTQMELTLQSLVDMDERLRNLFDAVIPEAGRINALEQPSMRNPDPPISSSDTDASPVGTEAELVEDQLPSRPVIESDGAPLNPESLPSNPPHQSLRTHTTTRNVFRESNGLANQVDRERIYALLHRIEYGTNNHTPNQVDHLSHPMGMGVGSVQANPEALASNLSVPGSVSPSRPSSMRIEVDPIRSSDRHKRT
ncbi:hypothetical protein PSTT_02332 [Puccinia striiformis]|uniref:Uncharacterized protein n=1 Tax=Puccinia striiformis TaxID=27350 RepID=A0A2S4W0A9_9BASI|nr:hypothetical protein PSTT_02332 [Puccinia striiformis]